MTRSDFVGPLWFISTCFYYDMLGGHCCASCNDQWEKIQQNHSIHFNRSQFFQLADRLYLYTKRSVHYSNKIALHVCAFILLPLLCCIEYVSMPYIYHRLYTIRMYCDT